TCGRLRRTTTSTRRLRVDCVVRPLPGCESVRSGAPPTLREWRCSARSPCYSELSRMSSTVKLVVPVRFSGGGLSMQSTTSRIGAEGVFVRSLVPPIEGSRLELSLSLPGSARPVDAKGIVGPRTVEAAKESGFWVQFDSLSDEAQAFLDVLLRSRGVVGPGRAVRSEETVRADKPRAYPRVPARLRVGWTSARDFLVAYSEHLSRGGIF